MLFSYTHFLGQDKLTFKLDYDVSVCVCISDLHNGLCFLKVALSKVQDPSDGQKKIAPKKSAAAVNAIICINLSGSWRCRRKNDQAAEVAGAVIKFCETDALTHSLFR